MGRLNTNDNFPTLIMLTLLSTAAIGAVITFSAMTSIPNNGIFNNSIGNISKKYETDITPADYAFSIWGLIYLWQLAWLIYAFTTICRTNSHGPVMINPVVLPASVHLWYIFSCLFSVAWLFIWDRELIVHAAAALLLSTLSGYIAVTQHSKAVLLYENQLQSESMSDLICIRVLIQNGMDLFYSWTTLATLLNISSALTFGPLNISNSTSSTLCLLILGLIIVAWSYAENTVLFDLFSYVYSWYFVLIWAFAGIIVKNPDTSNQNTVITIVLLCLSVICLAAKLLVFFLAPPRYQKTKKYKYSSFK